MDITVITVTYNSEKEIDDCARSLLSQQDVNFEWLVVDNASQDNTLENLASYDCQLIKSRENLGFGKANNLAAKKAKGRYIYLLNPDAQLQGDDALAQLLKYARTNPDLGAIGTRVVRGDGRKDSVPSAYYPGAKGDHSMFEQLPGDIAWVIGASMLLPREIFQTIQGFDEDFFLYGEETDLCLRLRKAGHGIGYCDNVVVNHIQGASECCSDVYSLWERKEKGLHLFWHKHFLPEKNRALIKERMHQARRRRFSHRLKGLVCKRSREKAERYRAVYDVCQEDWKRM